jgi:hypothetical protein
MGCGTSPLDARQEAIKSKIIWQTKEYGEINVLDNCHQMVHAFA